MFWAGIVNIKVIDPLKAPDGVKKTSANYCEMLKAVLLSLLEDASLSHKKMLP